MHLHLASAPCTWLATCAKSLSRNRDRSPVPVRLSMVSASHRVRAVLGGEIIASGFNRRVCSMADTGARPLAAERLAMVALWNSSEKSFGLTVRRSIREPATLVELGDWIEGIVDSYVSLRKGQKGA